MSGNLSLPRSHVPAPVLSEPRPGCHPSSMTANGRFAPLGDNSTMLRASVSTVAALFFPYAQYQSLLPYIGCGGKRGLEHICLQNVWIAAKALSPARPARHITSQTA